jgi:TonB family protein
MRQETDLCNEHLGSSPAEDVSDLFTVAAKGAEGQPASQFPFMSLELSGDAPVALPACKVVKKDLVLATAGAFLVHVFVAMTVSLSAFLRPLPHPKEAVISVYLTEANETGCSSGDSGGFASTNIAEDGKGPGKSAPPEKAVVFSAVNAAKAGEQTVPTMTDTKRPVTRPKIRHEPRLPNLSAVSNENVASTKETTPQSEGTGLDQGQGQGKGPGSGNHSNEGPGFSGPGGSTFGSGIAGELDVTKVDQVPQILKKIEPVYPNRARTLGISGRVMVKFLVEPDGHVSRPSVVEAHPTGYFEQSALEAVRQWRFKPGFFRGQVVATWVTLPVQFRIIEQD